jgi:hypothetical protein
MALCAFKFLYAKSSKGKKKPKKGWFISRKWQVSLAVGERKNLMKSGCRRFRYFGEKAAIVCWTHCWLDQNGSKSKR